MKTFALLIAALLITLSSAGSVHRLARPLQISNTNLIARGWFDGMGKPNEKTQISSSGLESIEVKPDANKLSKQRLTYKPRDPNDPLDYLTKKKLEEEAESEAKRGRNTKTGESESKLFQHIVEFVKLPGS